MRTIDFARQLADIVGDMSKTQLIFYELIKFLDKHHEGYGVKYNDKPRGEAREYARLHGYFWLPCILCGKWRGGHESGNFSIPTPDEPGSGIGVCSDPKCQEQAKELAKMGYAVPADSMVVVEKKHD